MNDFPTTPNPVKITGIKLIDKKPWKHGDRLIAAFDCEVNGFAMDACLLIKTKNGELTARIPKVETPQGHGRDIRIIDSQLRQQFKEAASEAYRLFGNHDKPEIEYGASVSFDHSTMGVKRNEG